MSREMISPQTMRRQVIDGFSIHSNNEIREGRTIHGRGTITRSFNHPSDFIEPDKNMCAGCSDDFYNDHNPHGVKECWMYKKAVVVNKVGHSSIHVESGPNVLMRHTLSCWHGVSK